MIITAQKYPLDTYNPNKKGRQWATLRYFFLNQRIF